jgi:hypothetical protein
LRSAGDGQLRFALLGLGLRYPSIGHCARRFGAGPKN